MLELMTEATFDKIGKNRVNYFYINTEAILLNPRRLIAVNERTRVVVPRFVEAKLEKLAKQEREFRLFKAVEYLKEAHRQGKVVIDDNPHGAALGSDLDDSKVEAMVIANMVAQRKRTGEPVYAICYGAGLYDYCRTNGIPMVDTHMCFADLKSDDSALKELHTKVERKAWARAWKHNLGFLVALSCFLLLLFMNRDIWQLIGIIKSSVALLVGFSAMICGLFFYWFRTRFRLIYGVLEIFIGCMIAASINIEIGINRSTVLQLLGGMYVIVRGLDNAGKWINDSSLSELWRKLSGE